MSSGKWRPVCLGRNVLTANLTEPNQDEICLVCCKIYIMEMWISNVQKIIMLRNSTLACYGLVITVPVKGETMYGY